MEGELAAGTPQKIERPPRAMPEGPFRKLDGIARVVIFFITANVVLDVAATFTDLQMVGLLDRVKAGEPVTFDEASALDTRMYRLALMQLLGVAIAGIPFVMWFRRAYRNLGALGIRRVRFKPGWAVGGWFVPFLNVVRPKAIANDIWRATDPQLPADAEEPPPGGHVSRVLNWWWGAFMLSGFLYGTGNRITRKSTLDDVLAAARRYAVADTVSVIAGILAIFAVWAITQRVQRRHATRAQAPQQESSAPF